MWTAALFGAGALAGTAWAAHSEVLMAPPVRRRENRQVGRFVRLGRRGQQQFEFVQFVELMQLEQLRRLFEQLNTGRAAG